MKSAFRHFMDWWLEHRKCGVSENGIEDAICAVLFNAQAYLLKVLKDKNENEKHHNGCRGDCKLCKLRDICNTRIH